jgi:hypothetical protein
MRAPKVLMLRKRLLVILISLMVIYVSASVVAIVSASRWGLQQFVLLGGYSFNLLGAPKIPFDRDLALLALESRSHEDFFIYDLFFSIEALNELGYEMKRGVDERVDKLINVALEKGADLQASDGLGCRSIHHAILHENHLAMQKLIGAGVDLDVEAVPLEQLVYNPDPEFLCRQTPREAMKNSTIFRDLYLSNIRSDK